MRTTILSLIAIIGSQAQAEDHPPRVDQADLAAMVAEGRELDAFLAAFEAGDELTERSFDAERGVGAHIGEGRRFARAPRADLTGPGEWANHFPKREGGANATSCVACHNAPFANGAGDVALNVLLDPAHTGNPALYLERNTLPLFGLGIPQRLAEEISLDLHAQRTTLAERACARGSAKTALRSKGVSYGTLAAVRITQSPCAVDFDTTGLSGIDADLVVKPFGWKGNAATIRGFTRIAAHNELGLQAVELVGTEDGDFDGITGELSVGELTALTVYMAALERPVSRIELADLGLETLTQPERDAIELGETLFDEIGCAACHVPSMQLDDPIFREPSRTPGYFDVTFPDGSDPVGHGLSQETAVSFDLSYDQPNNRIGADGDEQVNLGALQRAPEGGAIVRWYTDFRRHDMGPVLADPDDSQGLDASMFLTRSLAGVATTGPWLHDGRATTLAEAIAAHGGAAETSASAFEALDNADRDALIAFLENLTMYQHDDAG